MPVRNSPLREAALAAHKQLSFEQLVASWLLSGGWEVLIPAIDHGKKTDLVVADDSLFYRVQVKSVESNDESIRIENKWKGAKIDYVVVCSRTGDWGYIMRAFEEDAKRLNSDGHVRFHAHPKSFLKAFSKI